MTEKIECYACGQEFTNKKAKRQHSNHCEAHIANVRARHEEQARSEFENKVDMILYEIENDPRALAERLARIT